MILDKGKHEQNKMIYKINELKEIHLLKEKSIIKEGKKKSEKKQIIMVQKGVLKNTINLYHNRTDIINAFVNKNFLSGNLEADLFDESKDSEPEPPFAESISEKTKMKRQKKSDEESQDGQGLRTLTPNKMLSRLSVTSRNNLEKPKNENKTATIFFASLKKN